MDGNFKLRAPTLEYVKPKLRRNNRKRLSRLLVHAEQSDKEKEDYPLIKYKLDRVFQRSEKALEMLEKDKIDGEGFSRMVYSALSDEFPEANVLKWQWYDVDGNKIENLTKKQQQILLQGRGLTTLTEDSKTIDVELGRGLMKNVFADSLFEVEFNRDNPTGTRSFEGNLNGDPDEVYRILQERMALEYPELVLVQRYVLEDAGVTLACVVGYRDHFAIAPALDPVVQILCTGGGFIALNGVMNVDLSVITPGAALWNGFLLPLGVGLVMLSSIAGQAFCSLLYGIAPSRHYYPAPVPFFGFLAFNFNNCCLLPNRNCLIDQVLFSTLFSGVTSLFLMTLDTPAVPFDLRLLANDFGWHEAAGELTNVTLISSELFNYSAILSDFATQLSTAILATEDGGSLIAIRPLALAGVMGLHITAFSLLPAGCLNGGRILQGVGGTFIHSTVGVITLLLIISLAFSHPSTIWPWAVLLPFYGEFTLNEQRRNEFSPPGPVRSILGLTVIGMALFSVMPPDWFEFVFHKSPSTFVDQVGAVLSFFH